MYEALPSPDRRNVTHEPPIPTAARNHRKNAAQYSGRNHRPKSAIPTNSYAHATGAFCRFSGAARNSHMPCRRCNVPCSPLNQRLRIDGFRNFVRLKSPAILANMRCSDCRKGLMPVDSYDCSILRMLFGGKRRQTFIGFDGFVILEQHLVSAAQFRFAHKYDDACGKSVQTVRGNNIRFAILFPKSNQRGFAIPHATRCGGEKMRFVNHDNRIVLVKNLTFERNARLFKNVTMPLLLTLLAHRMNDYSTVTDLARLRGLSTS